MQKYRIIKEENRLTNKVQFFIEQYTGMFTKVWTRELSLDGITGQVGAQTLHGARTKLRIIRSGDIIVKEEVILHSSETN